MRIKLLFVIFFSTLSTQEMTGARQHFVKIIILLHHCLYFIAAVGNNKSQSLFLRRNIYVIEVSDGEHRARSIATKLKLLFLGQVGSLENLYFVEDRQKQSRWKKNKVDILPLLEAHRSVSFVQEQRTKKQRVKRGFFQDPYYSRQWYLEIQTGSSSCDLSLNVVDVWRMNITGKNTTVSVLDDGLERTHPDLKRNYDAVASFDYNDHDSDPTPRLTAYDANAHGTRCAGEIAAEGGNDVCGVGVAYNANIGGIRLIDGPTYDSSEAASLSHKWHHVDIYSNSWGPADNGQTMDGPGPLTIKAIQDGVVKGRNGLGSIYVWAAGNGGQLEDYCSCDGFINLPETIAINAVDQCGNVPHYAENCPGVLATVYSSGKAKDGYLWKISTTDLRGECTSSHTGTSAAAPLAAGVFALVLEANRNITWRDLQYLIVESSKPLNPGHSSWKRNGAGHLFSTYYGFGVLDAAAIVSMATDPKWKTVSDRHICQSEKKIIKGGEPLYRKVELQKAYVTDGCNDSNSSCVQRLENVILLLSLRSYPRGGIRIVLKSPSRTVSEMLKPRRKDTLESDISEWKFLSLQFWGENPTGVWTISIVQTNTAAKKGYLYNWQIIFQGTCDRNSITTNSGPEEAANSLVYYTIAASGAVFVVAIGVTLLYVRQKHKWKTDVESDGHNVVSFSNESFHMENVKL